MAELMFKQMIDEKKEDIECDSAGLSLTSGLSISKNSASVLKELGIDTRDFHSKSIKDIPDLNSFHLFVVMTNGHKEALKSLGISEKKIKVLAGGVPDPYLMDESVYRQTRDIIKEGLDSLYREIQQNRENPSDDN